MLMVGEVGEVGGGQFFASRVARIGFADAGAAAIAVAADGGPGGLTSQAGSAQRRAGRGS